MNIKFQNTRLKASQNSLQSIGFKTFNHLPIDISIEKKSEKM